MTLSTYEDRYQHGHSATASKVKDLQTLASGKVRCAYCGGLFDRTAVEAHHTKYLGDQDTPGENLFAVCGSTQEVNSCHWRLHQKPVWVYDDSDPVNGNHNVSEIVNQLQQNFLAIRQEITSNESAETAIEHQPEEVARRRMQELTKLILSEKLVKEAPKDPTPGETLLEIIEKSVLPLLLSFLVLCAYQILSR